MLVKSVIWSLPTLEVVCFCSNFRSLFLLREYSSFKQLGSVEHCNLVTTLLLPRSHEYRRWISPTEVSKLQKIIKPKLSWENTVSALWDIYTLFEFILSAKFSYLSSWDYEVVFGVGLSAFELSPLVLRLSHSEYYGLSP